jgi:hypothetical protein
MNGVTAEAGLPHAATGAGPLRPESAGSDFTGSPDRGLAAGVTGATAATITPAGIAWHVRGRQ